MKNNLLSESLVYNGPEAEPTEVVAVRYWNGGLEVNQLRLPSDSSGASQDDLLQLRDDGSVVRSRL